MFAKKSICAKEILEGGRISLHQRPTTSLIQMRRIHRENPVISGIKKQGISGPIFPGNPAENGKFKMLNQISKDRAKGKYRMKKSAIITSRPLMNNLKRLETKESLGQYFYILSETRMLRNHYFSFFVRPKFAIFSKIC